MMRVQDPMADSSPLLRFAVLHHEGVAEPHFDLLFEREPGSALAAFRSPVWPITQATELTALKDHRREYLEYEGPVSGDRGHVTRVAGGTVRVEREDHRTRVLHLMEPAGESSLIIRQEGCLRYRYFALPANG